MDLGTESEDVDGAVRGFFNHGSELEMKISLTKRPFRGNIVRKHDQSRSFWRCGEKGLSAWVCTKETAVLPLRRKRRSAPGKLYSRDNALRGFSGGSPDKEAFETPRMKPSRH